MGIRLVGAIPVLGALGEDSGLRGDLGGCIEMGAGGSGAEATWSELGGAGGGGWGGVWKAGAGCVRGGEHGSVGLN